MKEEAGLTAPSKPNDPSADDDEDYQLPSDMADSSPNSTSSSDESSDPDQSKGPGSATTTPE